MSKKIDEGGGPAYPPNPNSQYTGMSLRDWFAGQALAGSLAGPDGDIQPADQWADRCYEIADAMLERRKR